MGVKAMARITAVLLAVSLPARVRSESPATTPTAVLAGIYEPIPFEGLGLDAFSGDRSIAAELKSLQAARHAEESWDLGMTVAGPGTTERKARPKLMSDLPAPSPLKATVKSRVQGFDVQAGLDGDAEAIRSGQARWVGGVGMHAEGSLGRAELAVRTSMRYAETARLYGFELGPRYERSLPGGLTFFLDGKAQAETAPSAAQRVWTPPVSAFEGVSGIGFGSVGIVGNTGIVR